MSIMEQNSYEEQFCEAVTILVEEGVESAGYDKTITAQIVACIDSLKGQYKIKYQDSYYYATSDNVEVEYSKDTQVYVLIPGNDFSREKKIVGTVKDLGDAYVSTWEDENQYMVVGRNCAEFLNPLSLCSYKSNSYDISELIVYQKDADNNKVKIETEELKKYLEDSEKIRIGATFANALDNPAQRQKGNFGISVKANFLDTDNTTIISKTFNLEVDDMVGTPYSFTVPAQQYLDFDIVGKNFIEITQVTLLIADFPLSGEGYPEDIFISDLVIEGLAPPDAKVFTTYYLNITSSKGTYLTEKETGTTLEATLSLKNKTVTSNNLEFYWFIEDARVDTSSELYCSHGGQGWRCLNDQKEIKEEIDGKEVVRKEWVGGSAIHEVDSDINLLNIKTVYKCVCVYDNGKASIGGEIELENSNAPFNFVMESTNGTEFILDRGLTTLKFIDNNIEGEDKTPNTGLTYHWAKEDSSGKYYYLGGENEGNGGELPVCDRFDNSTLMNYLRDLNMIYDAYLGTQLIGTKSVYSDLTDPLSVVFKTTFGKYVQHEEEDKRDDAIKTIVQNLIYVLGLSSPTNQELADAIQPYLDSHVITYIDQSIFYNLPARAIFNHNTFKCTATFSDGKNELVVGTARIKLTNKQVSNDNSYIIIENGNQTFKYSAEGVSPTQDTKNPLTLKPLTFKLYDEKGEEVKGIKDEDITWFYPLENTLITGESEDEKSENELWGIRHGRIFTFGIESRFKYNASNNVIKIEVKHQDRIIRQDTSFSFVKDGMAGTNGTDYFCRIVPKYDLDNAYPTIVWNRALAADKNSGGAPVYLNKPEYTLTNGQPWFTVELWNGSELISSNYTADFKMLFPSASISDKYFSLIEIQNNLFYFNPTDTKLKMLDELNSYEEVKKEGQDPYNLYKYGMLNIVRAEVSYQGKKYFAELPVAFSIINTVEKYEGVDSAIDYVIQMKPGSGFNEVVYAADGARPQYADSYPFEIQVIKYDKDGTELDLTYAEKEEYSAPLTYSWYYTLGRYRHIIYNSKKNKFLTAETFKKPKLDENGNEIKDDKGEVVTIEIPQKCVATPSPYYNGASTDLGLTCRVKNKDDKSIGTLYFPIHFMLNKFGYSALNDWDGTSVEIDNDKGFILSPQIGAGKKDTNNRFTGVLMGEMKSGHDADSDIGLLGFHEGVRTIFLDAETGKAEFGKTGSGQIILDPTKKDTKGRPLARIYSGEYYTDNTKIGTAEEKTNGAGLLIDFTTPEIKFGSGKFEVNSEGEIKSTAGYIGGWNIELDRLWGQYTKTEDNKTTTYYNSLNLWNENEGGTKWSSAICIGSTKLKSTKPADANFTVSQTGILNAKGASIDGDIVAKSLQLTAGSQTNVYIKDEVDENLDTAIQNLDPENLAYTNRINVVPSIDPATGQVHTKITVSNPNGGVSREWETVSTEGALVFNHPFGTPIDNDDIAGEPDTNGTNQSNKEGYVKISKEGLLTAHNAFIYGDIYANNGYFAGELKATTGEIGGWYIGSHRLYASYGGKYTRLQDGSLEYSIVVGGSSSTSSGDNAPFGVKHDGSFHATKATITGTLTAGTGSKIGPWTVSSSAIYKGDSSYPTSTSGNIYIGEDGISLGANFKVSKTGEMTASSGSFSGSLDGASGKFAGDLTASTTKFTKLSAGNGALVISENDIRINPGDNKAKIWIGNPKDAGWEDISIFPYSHINSSGKPVSCGNDNDSAKGNVGTRDYPFHVGAFINMHYSSERYLKNNIQMYNTNQAYDELKTLPIFTFNYRQKNEKETADLKLGTMIDYIPAEVMAQDRAYENRAYEIGNLIFWDIAATQVIQQKLEETIQEKETLQNRLDILEQKFLEMEEKLNGFN